MWHEPNLLIDGERARFRQGDSLNGWTLEKVSPRSVTLRTPEGEERVLTLGGESGEETAKGSVAKAPSASRSSQKREEVQPSPVGPAGSNYRYQEIDDGDVPQGYRKVSTPFGDRLVEERR